MDMKKILQAFDGASAKKPVEGSDSMKKFLSIVSEAPKASGISKEKETKFHKKLDTLVHKTFGKRKDEDVSESIDKNLSFKDYLSLAEAKKKITASEDPCWKGYKMVGTKKKGGREVPNCVPGKKGD
jgi:hypothetical protein